MFRTVPLSITRSSSLYIHVICHTEISQWVKSYPFVKFRDIHQCFVYIDEQTGELSETRRFLFQK